jgi:hypothetical protein
MRGASHPDDTLEVSDTMGAFDPEVIDAVWQAVEALLPRPPSHTIPSAVTGPGCPTACAS